jgi:hypothetical protein
VQVEVLKFDIDATIIVTLFGFFNPSIITNFDLDLECTIDSLSGTNHIT